MPKTVLKKDKKVDVQTKTGRNYSYKFTTLAQIHEWLEENNLRYTATIKNIEGNDYMFIQRYQLLDGKLQPIEEPMQEAKIPQVQGVQDYGGVLTSCRRYSLLMAFGLACEDNDNAKDGMITPEEAKKSQEEWKRWHTSSPNKLPSQRQRETIANLARRAGRTDKEVFELSNKPQTSAEASEIIQSLGNEIDRKEK